jgi:hypothetical protein
VRHRVITAALLVLYVAGITALLGAPHAAFADAGRVAWFGGMLAAAAHLPFLLGLLPGGRGVATTLVAVASIAHVALLCGAPLFSDDVWRYAVDATLTHAGIHPFAYAPDSQKLLGMANGARALTNHPQMRTIYPPGAQAYFVLLHWPGSTSITGLRVGATVAAALACVAAARSKTFSGFPASG